MRIIIDIFAVIGMATVASTIILLVIAHKEGGDE